jgi:hypothetical protein
MTIGIGAAGPRAGLAVFRALQIAERAGSGSIGGYAVFAAIAGDGTLHRAETQRGGTATLFTAGERTGVEPPDDIANAPFAALMSSGPDRPAPLSQFLPGDGGIGLVTGHRLPNAAGPDGVPLNASVLAWMGRGLSADAALARVLDAAPDADAGMIALGPGRGIAMLNSARVARRPDLGSALATSPAGAAVAILHNAIWPARTLAPLLAEIALEVMVSSRAALGTIEVRTGVAVVASERDRVIVDDRGVAVRIETTDARIVHGRWNCAAIYVGAEVVRDGSVLGATMEEPNVVVEDGVVVRLSGQPRFVIPYGEKSRK